ncbi:MAG: ADP-ribosylglycohydrolase family protein [Micrococcales bacterium]|nr:ADP-ribosylglycohydrolase family protein [Micrococcales bacterium]
MNGDAAELTAAQLDRAIGAVIGMAVGNALGSGYAFAPKPHPADIHMRAGGLGPYTAGEWADDTAMAMPILEVLAAGGDLLSRAAQDQVAARWVAWVRTAKDVAPIISDVLRAYDRSVGAESLRRAATVLHTAGTAASGNGSLMRTTPITLGYLHDEAGLALAARTYSDLTHGNPEAAEACILWNLAQRRAILDGRFDVRAGLSSLPANRARDWDEIISTAEAGLPQDFAIRNGWGAQMVQTVCSAITHCEASGPGHFEETLRLVVSSGGDTPTSAAVAGSLLGARWGLSAIPLEWRRRIHGWPGMRDAELMRLAWQAVTGKGWPVEFAIPPMSIPPVVHPDDAGVLLGGVRGLRPLPSRIDAVVSLCRLGELQVPSPPVADEDHINVWLIDSDNPADNPNLSLVAEQAVGMLMELRAEGRAVYLHCDDGRSRTPFIASLYGARLTDTPARDVLREIQQAVPLARLNPVFQRMIYTFT